jgi:cell filamentation protein
MNDPYVDASTGLLRNRLRITEPDVLAQAESEISYQALVRIGVTPVPGDYDLAHFQRFHGEIFGDLYPWAGQIRSVDIAKGAWFCPARNIGSFAADVFGGLAERDHLRGLDRDKFVHVLAELYGDINALHPFREGNGRAQRAFVGQLARDAGYRVAWERMSGARNDAASASSLAQGDQGPLRAMLGDLVE